MVSWRLKWRRAKRVAATVLTWVGLVAGALPLVAPLATPLGGRVLPAIAFVRSHGSTFWMFGLSAVTIALLIWVTSLHRRFATRFKDDFKKPVNLNWDYRGNWHVSDENALVVTDSSDGGLTKVGALWENYTFSFQAKILRNCLGVVVRARDLDNYYMFQIGTDRITPHRRVPLPVQPPPKVAAPSPSGAQTQSSEMQLVAVPYVVVWQVMQDMSVPLGKQIATWFNVDVTVRGESIQIYIDNELVFEQQSLLQNAIGKVGFRNHGAEMALVRRVRVQVLS